MFKLACGAYFQLIRIDLYFSRGDFLAMYERVRRVPLGKQVMSANATEPICRAVDIACTWYWKEVLCLQRSAATVCLLRRSGIAAQMVIGIQQMPLQAHAWVEAEGRVVNDKAYVSEIYAVLARC
jgi:hypothetical protein